MDPNAFPAHFEGSLSLPLSQAEVDHRDMLFVDIRYQLDTRHVGTRSTTIH